jgi:hypothetical protein
MGYHESTGQGRLTACLGYGQQGLQRLGGQPMTRDRVVVFDAEHQHSTFCIGKAGPIAGNLITHLATIAGLLFTRRTVKQRLAIEMLTFVLAEEGLYIEEGPLARHPTASSNTCPLSWTSRAVPLSNSLYNCC